MKKFPTATQVAFAVVSLLTIVQCVWWYPRLPDVVPSHFDMDGNADATMSKTAYCVTMGVVHASLMLGFPLLVFFSNRIPASLMNLPNKEYWLADGRREDSLGYMNRLMLQIGIWAMLLMASLFHLSSNVAIKARDKISPDFYWLFAGFIVIVVAYLIQMNLKFRRPPENTNMQTSP